MKALSFSLAVFFVVVCGVVFPSEAAIVPLPEIHVRSLQAGENRENIYREASVTAFTCDLADNNLTDNNFARFQAEFPCFFPESSRTANFGQIYRGASSSYYWHNYLSWTSSVGFRAAELLHGPVSKFINLSEAAATGPRALSETQPERQLMTIPLPPLRESPIIERQVITLNASHSEETGQMWGVDTPLYSTLWRPEASGTYTIVMRYVYSGGSASPWSRPRWQSVGL